jgi:hypothetical protein
MGNLTSLPCQLIYDTRIDKETGFSETMETRRCGLIFGKMSECQSLQLNAVLHQHA